jgi:hypothetical protein
MKPLRTLCLVLVAPGLMWAQTTAPKAESSSNDTELATELKLYHKRRPRWLRNRRRLKR